MSQPAPDYNPDFLDWAHKKSSSHKTEILSADLCGCFQCQETFPPGEIRSWIREREGGHTAQCPRCGIDAVLSSELPITDKEFLSKMYDYWFS